MDEENKDEGLTPLEERWEEISENINSYLEKVGAKGRKPEAVDKIMNMSYQELVALGHEECGEYSFILSQHAFFIQTEYNYHKSKVDWCDKTIIYAVANYGDPSTFIKVDEKAAKMSSTNQAIKMIMKMQATAKVFMTNLEGLSFKISSMSETLKQLQQSKRNMPK